MNVAEYEVLYALQDEVLSTVFEESLGFYLTGGTALSRFYLRHRYSDDLDFFTHEAGLFSDAFRYLLRKLQDRWPDMHLDVDGRDFKRLLLIKGNTKLKLDFISDKVPRIGLPVFIANIYVDTVRNILSNKISAIFGRDEARDVADLLSISRARFFSWRDVISETSNKESFQLEELLFRLRTFPVKALLSVPFVADEPLSSYAEDLEFIIQDIEQLTDNRLARQDAVAL